VAAEDYALAFPLIFKALQILPHDPALIRMRRDITHPIPVRTTPPGASVYVKPYSQPDSPWLFIGQSPLEDFLLPFGYYFRWRIVKPGYQTVEAATGIVGPAITFVLDRSDSVPPGMQHVPGGNVSVFGLKPVHLEDYWIDKFEVTNRQFKEFVDQGGYQKPQYWREPFVKDGRVLSWGQAMAEFRDTTGQPGPSTWEVGGYPPGHDDFPVNGVSWYEAAAYASFANKYLPTIYHWRRAAAQFSYSDILLFSNFGGEGPVPVGSRKGVGEFGTYDMAGNVKEWCLNAAESRRYILGGSWNEGRTSYAGLDALSPFDRSPTNGFRCVKYPNAAARDALAAPVDITSSDRRLEKPVSDGIFRILQRFYSYESTELKPVREQWDESSPDWKTERVSFNATYDHEQVIAWLYLPKHARPPFQTIIYFPAGASRILPRLDEAEVKRFDFLMRSGRAVVLPVYQGTYERRLAQPQEPGRGRDLMIQQVQDFRRSIDYLETRTDIARDRLGFFGISSGSQVGIIALAQEPRIRAATLAESGIGAPKEAPEIDPLNFAPRVRVPVLMLNGRYDFVRPVETQQLPLFRLLGAPPNEKRMVLSDGGHAKPIRQYIKETLDWFDRYLGSVVR
jgi:pimeloyl-ACP methyl ester carboxylesterase